MYQAQVLEHGMVMLSSSRACFRPCAPDQSRHPVLVEIPQLPMVAGTDMNIEIEDAGSGFKVWHLVGEDREVVE